LRGRAGGAAEINLFKPHKSASPTKKPAVKKFGVAGDKAMLMIVEFPL
jgi:hypothetical protein